MEGAGYLAIWSDLAPSDETDWMHWITREHAAERVGVDGFLACRIFRALGTAANRYFILYELKQPEIVGSPQYLARLNAPTPWSQRTMPRLQNFARGGGRVVASSGIGQAGVLAVLRLDGRPDWDAAALTAELAGLRQDRRGPRPAHRPGPDLDRDPRKGHAQERRVLCRPVADRGP